jgi:hypothetical protein
MRVGLAKAAMDARVAAEMLGWSWLARNIDRITEENDMFRRFVTALESRPQKHVYISQVSLQDGMCQESNVVPSTMFCFRLIPTLRERQHLSSPLTFCSIQFF